MEKDKKTEKEYWLDVYTSYKKDDLSKDFYKNFNVDELKFLAECRFEELLR